MKRFAKINDPELFLKSLNEQPRMPSEITKRPSFDAETEAMIRKAMELLSGKRKAED